MTTPVYLLVVGTGFTEAWHQLSKAEQDELWGKVEEADRRAGGTWVILCNSRWADEQVFDWGVLEYPDINAYRTKVDELEKLNWWRYWSAKTILGTGHGEPVGSRGVPYATSGSLVLQAPPAQPPRSSRYRPNLSTNHRRTRGSRPVRGPGS